VDAFLFNWIQVLENGQKKPDMERFIPYAAEQRTREQLDFFESVLTMAKKNVRQV
jgi:hypothetical protein